ncbi:tyrosyl-DNA phosphodiesterase 2 isoform X2 [Octodon degus]|uniref:Tyrosyl-DNA phosphodiesterase 2 n=1 Tax=Octodon degus TaxID=10160 RepID=A0A6P6D6P1_OCTDE|nr:tyrosyl-DNA phosphodiesterase 2 isoform X2 [Octodon degus]
MTKDLRLAALYARQRAQGHASRAPAASILCGSRTNVPVPLRTECACARALHPTSPSGSARRAAEWGAFPRRAVDAGAPERWAPAQNQAAPCGVSGRCSRGGYMELPSGEEAARDEGEPEAKRRRLLCVEFASVASCDPAVARGFLAENNWEMERALNAYFEPSAEGSAVGSPAGPPVEPERWYSPDVVFLQEVIPPYFSYLKKRASSYEIITGHEEGYFTAIMLKKSRVKLKSQEIIPFPSTKMMRNLLCVHVSLSGHELCLMTSHLESTRGHAKERMNQLKLVLKKMQEVPESATVIFAGDTNLRDQEVTKCGGLPSNILDVWEFLEKPKHCQYTWDTQMNSNLGIPATCKLRFDRIFFRAAAEEGHIIPRSLDLLGLEKLDCGRFPSDHWGLLCNLDVIL